MLDDQGPTWAGLESDWLDRLLGAKGNSEAACCYAAALPATLPWRFRRQP